MRSVAIIPAFNEERSIQKIITDVKRYVDYVVVVDDNSKDTTLKIARTCGIKVLHQPVNMGVGFTTISGVNYAINELMPDTIVTIDGDGQHEPSDIPSLLSKITEGYDVVFAVRLVDTHKMPAIKRLGNYFLNIAAKLFLGVDVKDTQTGFKAFTRKAYEKMTLVSDGYEFCTEFTYEVVRNKIKYSEVPIKIVYDDYTKIKGTNFFTGILILLHTITIRFRK